MELTYKVTKYGDYCLCFKHDTLETMINIAGYNQKDLLKWKSFYNNVNNNKECYLEIDFEESYYITISYNKEIFSISHISENVKIKTNIPINDCRTKFLETIKEFIDRYEEV